MGLFDRFRKKKDKTKADNSNNATRHCFVLCKSETINNQANASKIIAEVFGSGYTAESDDGAIITISHAGKTVGFLAHMPAPIPGGEAEDNADGNFLWPDGREQAAAHRSHVIVTNLGAEDQTPIQSALNVTRLALVALKLFDGLGVYWGNASVCNSREIFEDFCEDISEDHVPVPVWLRFQLVPTEDDQLGIYTLGMQQFDLMDIEVDGCSMDVGELFEFVSNIAHYLIQNGPVIADGNTVGGSAEERILVRHRPSMHDKTKKVYKIIFDQ